MSGLRETLEAATPGPWGVAVETADLPDERYGDIVAYVEVGNLETSEMVGDYTPHLEGGSWEGASRTEADEQAQADARLAALAPELAALVLRVQAIATRGVGPDTTPEEALATIAAYIEKRLARLDQLGKEQT